MTDAPTTDPEPTYVVYTLDKDLKPGHFLAVVHGFDAMTDEMEKWWTAFRDGEKAVPKGYEGISSRPVAEFDRWESGEEADPDD